MINAAVDGFLLGLVISFLIGPVFFMLIDTTIQRGVRAAIAFDVGVFLSDVAFVIIAYLFASEISTLVEGENQWMSLAGGTIFILFGCYNFFKKKPDPHPKSVRGGRNYQRLFFKGLILNGMNPSVLAFWLAAVVMVLSRYEGGGNRFAYFLIALSTILFFDLAKIAAARKLRQLMTPILLVRINQVTGLIFFIFGVVLIVKGVVL